MKDPARLVALAQLQSLRERRERLLAEGARAALLSWERAHLQCLEDEQAAQDAMLSQGQEASLCLDRWRMLAGQLNLKAQATRAASEQKINAQCEYDGARGRLQREIARSEALTVRARRAARKFAARKDEARLQDVRSMNAGNGQGSGR